LGYFTVFWTLEWLVAEPEMQAAISFTFDLLVAELLKTTFLPIIQDDAINALLNLAQGSMSYALYTQRFNDFLRRSRQKLTVDVQCVRFINGMANFKLKTQAKSHRSQRGYIVQLVELQNFLNDVVTDSPYLDGIRSTFGPSTSPRGGQPTKKRNFEDPLVGASKIWKRNGGGRGRGRGRGRNQGGDRGQPSSNSSRIDFSAIAYALAHEERKKHIEEELYFKCHKKGHRLFQCPDVKGKAAIGVPPYKKQYWWQGCSTSELQQPDSSTVRPETLLATKVVDTRSTSPSTTLTTHVTLIAGRRRKAK
jgi:hypothetical protein